ncbi:MAG: winged helix-turn-helix transcriptional regulator [bacterium]|nr:MAG: winged helix-turn-helix transcriptional regulator [bacterium]
MKNPLENSIGFQMVVAARSMKRALEIKLSEHSITSSQYTVLEVLGKYNGLSLTELGKLLYFDNPTITGIINRMARAKLLKRRRDRNDRRVIKVYLTAKGWELQAKSHKIAQDVNKKAVGNFKEKEKEVIMDLAKRIHKNLMIND